MKLYVLLLLMLMFTGNSFAADCELTDEYLSARSAYVQQAKSDYRNCISSVSEADYWFRYTECARAGDGTAVAGGCSHVVNLDNGTYQPLGIDGSFCEVLRPSLQDLKEGFVDWVDSLGIRKCKF